MIVPVREMSLLSSVGARSVYDVPFNLYLHSYQWLRIVFGTRTGAFDMEHL